MFFIFVNKKIYFIGNGAEKYREQIVALLGDMAIFDKIIPFFKNNPLQTASKQESFDFKNTTDLEKELENKYDFK